ncbi:MAG: YcaO-like family protein, partial [Pseudomonadota bacterium]
MAETSSPEAAGEVDPQVRKLLIGLGYARVDAHTGRLTSIKCPLSQLQNRFALLSLASKFDRAFQLPLPHAPGAVFFGGMVVSSDCIEDGLSDQVFSVGGRGKTFSTAFESCMGEAAECLSFIRSPKGLKVGDRGSVAHEAYRQWAFDGIGASLDAPEATRWVEATSLGDLSPCLFPAELVYRLPACERIGTRAAESTGVAAGVTRDDAILAALLEVIERDAAALWWYGGCEPGLVPQRFLEQSGFESFASEVRKDSRRSFWLLDITTDVGVPVIAALSAEPDGTGVVAGFSASVDIMSAMESAFLEMCQMELAQALSLQKLQQDGPEALSPQDRAWIDKHEKLSLQNVPRLKSGGAFKPRLNQARTPMQFILDSLEMVGY